MACGGIVQEPPRPSPTRPQVANPTQASRNMFEREYKNLMDEIAALDAESAEVLAGIRRLL